MLGWVPFGVTRPDSFLRPGALLRLEDFAIAMPRYPDIRAETRRAWKPSRQARRIAAPRRRQASSDLEAHHSAWHTRII